MEGKPMDVTAALVAVAMAAQMKMLEKAIKKAENKTIQAQKQTVAVQKTLVDTQDQLLEQTKLKCKLGQAVAALPKPQAFAVFEGAMALTTPGTLPPELAAIVTNTAKWEDVEKMWFANCVSCSWAVAANDGKEAMGAFNAHTKAEHKGKPPMDSGFGWTTSGHTNVFPKWWA